MPLCRNREERNRREMKVLLVAAVVVLAVVDATVYFEERFEDGSEFAIARAAVVVKWKCGVGVGVHHVPLCCDRRMGRSVGAV